MNALLHALFAERELDLDTLCRLADVDLAWLDTHASLLHPAASDAWLLARVRRLVWLEREFDAVPELAALVVDLEEELRRLRGAHR
ncbi:MAG: MerR family transcriptional regulator [Inhella sp.]